LIADFIFSKGKWKLPIYKPPTLLDLDLRDVSKLTPLYGVQAAIRICTPNDEIYNQRATAQSTVVI